MKRNKHSLSHYKLLSGNMGSLIPIACYEALPGDTIQQASNLLIRCAPMLAPVMHPVNVRVHHWFVPNRILWDGWEDFITGGPDGMDTSVIPQLTLPGAPGVTIGSLADYLGIPPGVPNLSVNALPFRAYNRIFNEWYRDQDLQTPLVERTGDTGDVYTDYTLKNCAWEKDYFTQARPWEQKGPAITVPLGTRADIRGLGVGELGNAAFPVANRTVKETGGQQIMYPQSTSSRATVNGEAIVVKGTTSNGSPDVYADLTDASSITVTRLREAMALQRYEEARARYGSRYTEYLRYLGVKSSDGRLQRPEYLGGGNATIQFSEVLQTAEGTDPVGELRGHGIGAMRSNRFRRHFEEHGYVITLLSVRPKAIYGQGLRRTWNKLVKEDYWQKELEHIGQQPILNKEIYAGHTLPDDTFGYADRYADYREIPSTIAGEFRDTTLDYWHMARQFATEPALNSSFVECVPTERVFAVNTNDVLYVMANHSIQARRLVSTAANSFIY